MNGPVQPRPARPRGHGRFDARARSSLPVLVALCGLMGACGGKDAADVPASGVSTAQPASAESSARPSSSQQTATPPSSPGTSSPTPTVARPSVSLLGGPTDQNRSEPHIAVDPENPDRLYVVAQGALPGVSLDPQLFWRTEDGGHKSPM